MTASRIPIPINGLLIPIKIHTLREAHMFALEASIRKESPHLVIALQIRVHENVLPAAKHAPGSVE